MTCPRCSQPTDRFGRWFKPCICTRCLADWQIRSGFKPWQPGGLQIIGPHSKLNHKEA